MRSDSPDILMIGPGHNALVCAFYLAERGYKVRMRSLLGGWRGGDDRGDSSRVPQLDGELPGQPARPKLIRHLWLYGHDLRVVLRKIGNFLPPTDL